MDYQEYIKKCTVKILTSKDEIIGSGFWVLPDRYLLTCYHVFVSGKKRPADNFIKIGYDDKSLTAIYRYELSDPTKDIAVLYVDDESIQSIPFVILDNRIKQEIEDRKVRSLGYRKGFPDGYTLTGELQPGQNLNIGKVLNLVKVSLPDGSSIQGMSGAPVFDLESKFVVGILYAEEKFGPSTSYVHPISKVYDCWTQLLDKNSKASKLYSFFEVSRDWNSYVNLYGVEDWVSFEIEDKLVSLNVAEPDGVVRQEIYIRQGFRLVYRLPFDGYGLLLQEYNTRWTVMQFCKSTDLTVDKKTRNIRERISIVQANRWVVPTNNTYLREKSDLGLNRFVLLISKNLFPEAIQVIVSEKRELGLSELNVLVEYLVNNITTVNLVVAECTIIPEV